MFDLIRQWRERSFRNALALQVVMIVLVTVFAISTVSLGILFWLDRAAIKSELLHEGKVAAGRIEEPLRVAENALLELAKSTLLMTALLDSGGRANYVRPYLQNYVFPVSAPNGMALCDVNGVRLAGTHAFSECQAESFQFKQVLEDGVTQRTLRRNREGVLIWTIYAGITFSYTGTTEGVAVAQIDLDHVLGQIKTQPSTTDVALRVVDHDPVNLLSRPLGAQQTAIPLFDAKPMLDSRALEVVISDTRSGMSATFVPLMAGYLVTTVALMVVVLLRIQRWSRKQTAPLLALRDRAREIATTGDISLAIPHSSVDEVGQLAKSIEEMIGTIRQAEATQREAEERFRLVFEKSGEAILFGWPDGRIEMVNPEGLRLFGYDENSILQQTRNDLLDTSDPRTGQAKVIRDRTGVFKGELTCVDATGRRFPAEIVSTVFVDSKGEKRTTTLFRDISERKRIETEQAAQSVRLSVLSRRIVAVQEDAKRRMARELHDRTSPALAAISINLELVAMAAREQNGPEVEERISDTRALVNDTAIGIREISAELRPAALDYAGLVSALETYLSQFSRRTGIRVKADLPSLPQRLTSELESSLFRIAQEAITNITKHARATLVTVNLTPSQNMVCLEVIDNGQGFDPATHPGASGLGMINMREIAEFSGGVFTVSSEAGCGTRVCVQFDCGKGSA